LAAGVAVDQVSCATATTCTAVAGANAYRWDGAAWSGPTGLGFADGTTSVACPAAGFCMAVATSGQAATWNGTAWSPPVTVSTDQGLGAVACTGPTFCVTVDGVGNSFRWDGAAWHRSAGAWGAATGVSCATPTFCVAAEGAPSVWDGQSWSQPQGTDPVDAVSCPTATFCMGVGTTGDAVAWNGSGWSAAQPVMTATGGVGGGPDSTGGAGSGLDGTRQGLTAVSCPTTADCVAVGADGRAYRWDGAAWSAGQKVSTAALTSVSCVAGSCVATDATGHAYSARRSASRRAASG